jgi:hypothetical protein
MADAGRQIGFEQLGIGSVLSRNTLSVPLNQREYSWTEREVSDLFHDLAKAIRLNAPEYFLGTIVTIPRKPGSLEVVDGQQRLATTAILLAAIREALKGRETDKLIVERIENVFLSAIDASARKRVSRLTLNVTDASFFENRVLKPDPSTAKNSPSHKLIEAATDYAAKHVAGILKGISEKDFGDVLNQWVDFLEHRALVILLKVPSDVNAYKMFETLNDRGLKTSQSDLVKNYLFGEAGEKLLEAQQKWAAMKSCLESIEDDDITMEFLRQMLISLYGHVRKDEVYEKVQSNAKGSISAIQFMAKLQAGSGDYAAMLNSDHEKWNYYPPRTRRAIQTLILLPAKPMRPLLLSIIRTFSPKETDLALKLIVNISVRFLIVGGLRSGVVEETIAKAAKETSEGEIPAAAELLKFLQGIIPTDTQFEEQFKIATVSQEYLARYYLRSLETSVNKLADAYYVVNDDQAVINLEHILPESPEGNWPEFPPEVAAAYYKRIGNLVLMQAKQNSDLHSSSFDEKKKVYLSTPYVFTKQLGTLKTWNAELISKRQATMAAQAVKTWPISL